MNNARPFLINALWFVIGALAATGIAFYIVRSGVTKIANSEDASFSTLQRSNAELSAKLQNSVSLLQNTTSQLNTCTEKFARATVIYDSGLLGETRAWVIPVDVAPLAVGAKRGSYTHYDPKTQTETVHMQPKSQ